MNRMHEHLGQLTSRTLKLDFPKFNGENLRLWLRKCSRYFAYNQMTDYDKISLVANLKGVVNHWFVDYIEKKENLQWTKFTKLVLDRFMNPTGESLVVQFNRSGQITFVQSYLQEFEEMRALMKENNKALAEDYFVEIIIGRLKKEIGKFVTMQNLILY